MTKHNIPHMATVLEDGGASHLNAAAPPPTRLKVDPKKAADNMRIAADAIERGDVTITNGGQADSKNAAVAELGRLALAVAGMQTDETLGWWLRDNNPKN